MPISIGTQLGPYQITASLGAGGMGEVYKSRDTRLDRIVAIKVLPDHVARSPEARQRFEMEARAIAALSHPHICVIYDVGRHNDADYLVMEYLEGETLASRLTRGPLPLDQVLRYASEIASALVKAHQHGIVHRDLKPGNIMLTPTGAKLLDFGLAKLKEPAAAFTTNSSLPTNRAITAAGTILGTLQYMAPEQLEGKDADVRTDLFAFGATVYEMLTGLPAFDGKSQVSLMAAIINQDPPPIRSKQPLSPKSLNRVVKICLQKNPDTRWQTAADVLLQLQGIAEDLTENEVPETALSPNPRRLWMTMAVLMFLISSGLAIFIISTAKGQSEAKEIVAALTLAPPEKTIFNSIAIAPDGQQIAFTGRDMSGNTQLWVRSLNSFAARVLNGTEEAAFPFWSPDGRFIAFTAQGHLRKIDPTSGLIQTICEAPTSRGGSWSSDGTIILAPGANGPLFRVPAAGGKLEPLTQLDASKDEASHRWPFFLPDGHHYLFAVRSVQSAVAGIYLADLHSDKKLRLLPDVSNATYVPATPNLGRILFARGSVLMAQSFDARTLQIFGEPVAVTDKIGFSPGFSQGAYSASQNGTLVFAASSPIQDPELSWFDRDGKFQGIAPGPSGCQNPVLSPNQTRMAYDCVDPQSGSRDIWVIDLARGIASRLGPGQRPIWSPDGNHMVFAPGFSGSSNPDIMLRDSNAGAGETMLLKSAGIASAWSLDGRFLLFRKDSSLWVLPFSGDRPGEPFLYRTFTSSSFPINGGPVFTYAVFAPDARMIAYESIESGRREIYVERFTGTEASQRATERWQISNDGGATPQWSRDGSLLFYLSPAEKKVMVVEIRSNGTTIEPSAPKALFSVELSNVLTPGFGVTADGQRFLAKLSPPQNRLRPASY